MLALAAFVIATAAVLTALPVAGPPAVGRDLSRAKPTAGGHYVAALAPEFEPIARGKLHSWVLTLTTPDGKAVEDARIEIAGGMPSHRHGLPTSPQATAYLGGGRYRIEGVKFSMTGWWELRFAIAGRAGTDDVVFNLLL